VAAQQVDWEGIRMTMTASFGVAQCGPDEGVADLLARADAMLYHAKTEGRDRVEVSG
jgi:PleD family two-component response regulator